MDNTLINPIFATATVSITDLRRNPGAIIDNAGDAPIAILNHNRASAYLVSAKLYEAMLERMEDIELAELVRERRGGETVKVVLDDI